MPRQLRFFILRAPTVAVPVYLALGFGLTSLSAAQLMLTLRGEKLGALRWTLAGGWFAVTLVGVSTAFVALPLWARLRPSLAELPPAQAWAAYCALFFAAGCCSGVVRAALAAAWLPGLLTPGQSWFFIFNLAISVVVCALLAEAPAEYFRRHRLAAARRLALAARLDEAQARLVQDDDRARRELAELLHGRLQSRLVAALAKLEHAREAREPEAICRLLAEAACFAEGVRAEAFQQVSELAAHGPRSLAEAVDELLVRFGAMLPLSCTWGPGARGLALDAEAVRLSYRLLDEALLNAYRHARAERVTLALAIAPPGGLRATVQDDGVGFEPGTVRQGLGLAALGAALAPLGGSFELRSRPGEGTTVVIELSRATGP